MLLNSSLIIMQKIKTGYSFAKLRRHALVEKRERRAMSVRASIRGTKKRPRLSVFRSNKYIYAQLIDDESAHTLAFTYGKKKEAFKIGQDIALKAKAKSVSAVSYDRGRYKYHGHVKELAQGARKGGLNF